MLRFVEKADEDSRLLPRAASSRRPFPLPPLPRTAALRLIRPYYRDLPIGHRELLLKICLTPGWPPPPSCCASPFSGPSPLPQSPYRHHTSHLPLPRLSMLYLRPSSLRARPCGPSPYSLVFISSFTISFDKDQSLPPFCSDLWSWNYPTSSPDSSSTTRMLPSRYRSTPTLTVTSNSTVSRAYLRSLALSRISSI
jgi:hypothetical protein